MNNRNPLGIIAGGGRLPTLLAEIAISQGRPVQAVVFKGQPRPQFPRGVAVSEQALGAVGKVIDVFHEANVQELIMVGHLSKPSLFDLRPDMKGVKLLTGLLHKHDDALLTRVCEFLEKEGFKIFAVQDVAPELLSPQGEIGKVKPSESQMADIALGLQAATALGALDIGQAVIVKEGVVLGVEGIEGTNELIKRCAAYRGAKSEGGVLVKRPKPKQNMQVDVPAVGAETVELLAKHAYTGMAVMAGGTLLVDKDEMVRVADKNNIFLYGIASNDA